MNIDANIGSNHAVIKLGRVTLLFSYRTLVGVRSVEACAKSKHSRTTSSHQSKNGFSRFPEVAQEELEELATRALAAQGLEHIEQRIEGEEK